MVKNINCISILFLPIQSFGSEFIGYRQGLAQSVCLQFSTSFFWKLFAMWISLRSVHSSVDTGPSQSSLRDETKEALKFVLPFVLAACSHIVLFTPFHIHLFCIHFITVRLTSLAHSVSMKPNFQGLPWSECDGLGNDELLTLFLFN